MYLSFPSLNEGSSQRSMASYLDRFKIVKEDPWIKNIFVIVVIVFHHSLCQ